jgi:hypothetical protein
MQVAADVAACVRLELLPSSADLPAVLCPGGSVGRQSADAPAGGAVEHQVRPAGLTVGVEHKTARISRKPREIAGIIIDEVLHGYMVTPGVCQCRVGRLRRLPRPSRHRRQHSNDDAVEVPASWSGPRDWLEGCPGPEQAGLRRTETGRTGRPFRCSEVLHQGARSRTQAELSTGAQDRGAVGGEASLRERTPVSRLSYAARWARSELPRLRAASQRACRVRTLADR